jgi:non-specific serine/threonine protein kinase
MARGMRSQPHLGRLPAELTHFLGRRQEVAQVKRLLATARLVTLTGVGGTGKTRLALRVAEELQRGYQHGAWMVDLAPLVDGGLVEYTVAEALGIVDRSGHEPTAVVADYLRERELLLVLDNCEHVLDACAHFVDLMLRSAPGLRVLCTSRQSLGTLSEHVVRVPPLPVPEPGTDPRLRSPSIQLFAERAEAAAPGFAVTAGNQEQVAEICRRLDGLPLAIELAAAQLRTLSLDQLSSQLGDRLRGMRARHATPTHHRTLEATFDWSFELCSEEERALWARLSVFLDSVDLEAAGYVCAGGSSVLAPISGLVDKSVLLRDESGGQARYRLLDTVRQYGLRRLHAGGGDELELRSRHRDWYQELSGRFDAEWFGPRQEEWLALMRRERENVRAALDFCLTVDGDTKCALWVAACLQYHWLGASTPQEGRYWMERVLAANPEPTVERGWALAVQARVLTSLNEPDGAEVVARQCLALGRQLAEPMLVARAHADLGVCGLLRGDGHLPQTQALLEEALVLLDERQPSSVAIARIALAMCVLYQGDQARATALLTEVLAVSRAHGEKWWKATAMGALAAVDLMRGDPDAAGRHLRDSLALMRGLGDNAGMARALELLATVASAAGDHGRAARLLGAAHAARSAAGKKFADSADSRRRRADTLALARGAMTSAAGDAAFADGMGTSLADAISYALGEAGPDPGVPDAPGPHPSALSPRELEVAGLVAQGLSNKQIAMRLVVAQRTAESHVENILRKLEFSSRAQVAAWYARADGG